MNSITRSAKTLIEYIMDWKEALDESPFGGLMAVLMFLMAIMVLGIILAVAEAIVGLLS